MNEPLFHLMPEYSRLLSGLDDQMRYIQNFSDVLAKSEKDRYVFSIFELLLSIFENERRFASSGLLTRTQRSADERQSKQTYQSKLARFQREPEAHFQCLWLADQQTKFMQIVSNGLKRAKSRCWPTQFVKLWKKKRDMTTTAI